MAKRLSVILDDASEAVMQPFLLAGTAENAALQAWLLEHAGRGANTEAAAIRALIRAGAAALLDEALDVGYAELAALYDSDDADLDRREARSRYLERTEAAQ